MTTTGEHLFEHGPHPRVADELRSLLHGFADRAEPLLRKAAEHADDELPASCHWCPLCAALAVVRGQRPELANKAAEQGVLLVELLRAALGDSGHQKDSGSWTTSGHLSEEDLIDDLSSTRPQPVVRDRVQRIEVRRAGQWPSEDPDGGEAESAAELPDQEGKVQRITVRRKQQGDQS